MNRLGCRLQNSDRSLCRYISIREGEEMILKKLAIRVTARKNLRGITYRLIPQPESLRDMNEASKTSITRADMEAYVGIGSKGRINAAREKVAEFSKTRLLLEPVMA